MKLNRRDCFRAGALAGAGALISGCNKLIYENTAPAIPDSIALPMGAIAPIVRLVSRVSFGHTPGEIERVSGLGREKYVDEQLKTDGADDLRLNLRLHGNKEVLNIHPSELRDIHQSDVMKLMEQAALARAVYSPHQLHERMVDFWSNHFNIYARKGPGVYFTPTDQLNVIRKHALGKFPEMLRASATSPAMLCYLDNQVNQTVHPNENYAREIMELHTLGVHGGYTHDDIVAVSRCLTGWTVHNKAFQNGQRFEFNQDVHDYGRKVVLGHVIGPSKPGTLVYNKWLEKEVPSGLQDGYKVLDILSTHPSTARFIAGKLCRYFIGTDETPVRDQVAKVYLDTGGNIKSMLRTLLLSNELTFGPPILKRPFDFVASALRALNANTDGGRQVQYHLRKMGQPLHMWPMPDGYPDKTSAWTGSLLARWNFAFALAANKIPGTRVKLRELVDAAHATRDEECAKALIGLTLARRADEEPVKAIRKRVEDHIAKAPRNDNRPVLAETVALLIASPEFQWR